MNVQQFIKHFPEAIELIDKHIQSGEQLIMNFTDEKNFLFLKEHIVYYLKYLSVKHEIHPISKAGDYSIKVKFK